MAASVVINVNTCGNVQDSLLCNGNNNYNLYLIEY